jgi:hypothetical protein
MKHTVEQLDELYKPGTEIFCTGFRHFSACFGKILNVHKTRITERFYTIEWENPEKMKSGETIKSITSEQMIIVTDEKHKLSLILKHLDGIR